MKRMVRVVLIDEADSELKRLNEIVGQQAREGKTNTEEMQLLKSIKTKIEFIRANPFYGDNVPKDRIPAEYGSQNMWHVELCNHWRMLYTIKGDLIEVFCFVLDILDHEKYNKKFGYKKR